MLVDVQVAKEHGYTKVVLGVCSSRIAARAIAATAKVRIFSRDDQPLIIRISFQVLGMRNLSI